MRVQETSARIEPARIEPIPGPLADRVADLATKTVLLDRRLHPKTAASLADVVCVMNTYYSNLIEGHHTLPRDIENALAGELSPEGERRDLQLEAAAHVRVQKEIERLAETNALPEPASREFLRWIHREFYRDAPDSMLDIHDATHEFRMVPGEWRNSRKHDVMVGRHVPPSSERVAEFMAYFENRYRFEKMGTAARVLAMASAHHRFNYIHPFPDGNGRVSRLMSHAMALHAGVAAHGLWSVSRGLARGLSSRTEYKTMMDRADSPRAGDLDGRGNLSLRALIEFSEWFLDVCIDQVDFMSNLFDLDNLSRRLANYVKQSEHLRAESTALLDEALRRGEFERGEAPRITGLPERTARRVLVDTVDAGLLQSQTPKGAVSLRFPVDTLDALFPRLYPLS